VPTGVAGEHGGPLASRPSGRRWADSEERAAGRAPGFVLVFLAVIYRVLRLVADIALLIYALLLWGLIVAIPITMTLPGIAASCSPSLWRDANVVIFERIGRDPPRQLPHRLLGYGRGFRPSSAAT